MHQTILEVDDRAKSSCSSRPTVLAPASLFLVGLAIWQTLRVIGVKGLYAQVPVGYKGKDELFIACGLGLLLVLFYVHLVRIYVTTQMVDEDEASFHNDLAALSPKARWSEYAVRFIIVGVIGWIAHHFHGFEELTPNKQLLGELAPMATILYACLLFWDVLMVVAVSFTALGQSGAVRGRSFWGGDAWKKLYEIGIAPPRRFYLLTDLFLGGQWAGVWWLYSSDSIASSGVCIFAMCLVASSGAGVAIFLDARANKHRYVRHFKRLLGLPYLRLKCSLRYDESDKEHPRHFWALDVSVARIAFARWLNTTEDNVSVKFECSEQEMGSPLHVLQADQGVLALC